MVGPGQLGQAEHAVLTDWSQPASSRRVVDNTDQSAIPAIPRRGIGRGESLIRPHWETSTRQVSAAANTRQPQIPPLAVSTPTTTASSSEVSCVSNRNISTAHIGASNANIARNSGNGSAGYVDAAIPRSPLEPELEPSPTTSGVGATLSSTPTPLENPWLQERDPWARTLGPAADQRSPLGSPPSEPLQPAGASASTAPSPSQGPVQQSTATSAASGIIDPPPQRSPATAVLESTATSAASGIIDPPPQRSPAPAFVDAYIFHCDLERAEGEQIGLKVAPTIDGLIVKDMREGESPVGRWNARSRITFGTDQLLQGDIICAINDIGLESGGAIELLQELMRVDCRKHLLVVRRETAAACL